MSAYSEKIARQKQAWLYKVADLQNGDGTSHEVTHEIAFLLEDVQKFEQEMDILYFADTNRQLRINVTNGELLIEMFGEDPATWPGERVTLYLAPYGKEAKLGIRLKRPDAPTPSNETNVLPAPAAQPMDDEVPF